MPLSTTSSIYCLAGNGFVITDLVVSVVDESYTRWQRGQATKAVTYENPRLSRRLEIPSLYATECLSDNGGDPILS